jgi:hypothetical protein
MPDKSPQRPNIGTLTGQGNRHIRGERRPHKQRLWAHEKTTPKYSAAKGSTGADRNEDRT